MAPAQLLTDNSIDPVYYVLRERDTGLHEKEQHHTLVSIRWPSLPYTQRIGDFASKLVLYNLVDF